MTNQNISWQKSRQYTEEQLHTAAVVLEEIRSGTDTMKAVRAHPLREGGYIAKHMLVHVYRQKVKNGDFGADDALSARIRMKPIRSLSGVSTVTVLTEPYPCPGKCLFCPDDSQLPKSYLREEPGAARAQKGYSGLYFGIDFSVDLIAKAEKIVLPVREGQKIVFHQTDLNRDKWVNSLPDVEWDAVFCFAVLHHIPGEARRKLLCAQIRELLAVGKNCYISVWQPRNSPRLIKRIQSWESVGIDSSDVDPGDVLMDWRGHQKDGHNEPAVRFVHIFTVDELTEIARVSGFSVSGSFYSDGKEGNLGLYQRWLAKF